ncbi:MAG: hypothetical protein OdinLCB4_002525 [Candidatus Odinarchaeum yellowstonii]|uniref:D-aminoacyl-tRNA deacylase n=1 Tax=Odinarchaeota yellowstonii (strain LCB_4) TaxID=1841599 RepID=A0AAF0IBV5_ODILC|nr:MAG: hypothetical protein OdinLCB4_002525 [Candidatus Odinarchaeum yellowstonii]
MDAVIYSKNDPAGFNIAEKLRERLRFEKSEFKDEKIKIEESTINRKLIFLIETEESIIDFNLPQIIENAETIICASKHASQTGIPVLTTHAPGNFSTADFGGEPEKLSIANPNGMKIALKKMNELNTKFEKNYQVSYEVTHHGPTFDKPVMFIEVGGSNEQWMDLEAADIVSQAIIEVLSTTIKPSEVSIGVGGGHYAPAFTKLVIETNHLIGHIIPKYKLSQLKKEMFFKTVESNLGFCKNILIDWNGTPGWIRSEIINWSRELGLEVLKTSDISTSKHILE